MSTREGETCPGADTDGVRDVRGDRTAPETWLACRVLCRDDRVVGTVDDVLLDSDSATAEWVVVRLRGPHLRHHRAVPVAMLRDLGDDLRVATSRPHLVASPRVRPRQPMTSADELALYRYWHG